MPKTKWITPFANGSEATNYMAFHCDKCSRAYRPKEGEELPGIDETKQLIALGKECRMKAYLDLGFITGEIPLEIANEIGYENERLESCKKFTTEELPEQPIHNPLQLSLFDGVDENSLKNRTYEL